MLHRRDIQPCVVAVLKHSLIEFPMELVALGYFIALRAGFFVIFCIFFEIKFLPTVTTFELFSTFFQLDSSFVRMRVSAQDGLDVEQALYQLQKRWRTHKKIYWKYCAQRLRSQRELWRNSDRSRSLLIFAAHLQRRCKISWELNRNTEWFNLAV